MESKEPQFVKEAAAMPDICERELRRPWRSNGLALPVLEASGRAQPMSIEGFLTFSHDVRDAR